MSGPALNYQEEGRKLLTAFYGALSALRLYPLENSAVQQSLNDLHARVSRIVQVEGSAEIRVVGDFFFLNETRLRLDLSNFSTFGSFARALQDHGIGAVEILPQIQRAEWAPFLSVLLRKPSGDDPFQAFLERLHGSPVENIDFRPEREVQ
jgi:hypothetical protein